MGSDDRSLLVQPGCHHADMWKTPRKDHYTKTSPPLVDDSCGYTVIAQCIGDFLMIQYTGILINQPVFHGMIEGVCFHCSNCFFPTPGWKKRSWAPKLNGRLVSCHENAFLSKLFIAFPLQQQTQHLCWAWNMKMIIDTQAPQEKTFYVCSSCSSPKIWVKSIFDDFFQWLCMLVSKHLDLLSLVEILCSKFKFMLQTFQTTNQPRFKWSRAMRLLFRKLHHMNGKIWQETKCPVSSFSLT